MCAIITIENALSSVRFAVYSIPASSAMMSIKNFRWKRSRRQKRVAHKRKVRSSHIDLTRRMSRKSSVTSAAVFRIPTSSA